MSTQPQDHTPCPARLDSPELQNMPDSGWDFYAGDPTIFHCGFTGIVEVNPPNGHPQQECFFDENKELVPPNDPSHPYSGCAGSPNYHPVSWDLLSGNASEALDKLESNYDHLIDDVWTKAGWEGLTTSAQYQVDQAANWADHNWNALAERVENEWDSARNSIEESYEQATNWAENQWDSINDSFDRLYASEPQSKTEINPDPNEQDIEDSNDFLG